MAVSSRASGGGAPVFVADRGVWTDGVDDWLDTGFAPAAALQYQQDGATVGAWFRKSGTNTNQPIGTVTSNAVSLSPCNGGGLPAARVNATGVVATAAAQASGYGCTAATRSGSSLQLYVDGQPSGSAATGASMARSSVTIGVGRQNNTWSDGQVCALFEGTALSPAEHADQYAALSSYFTAIGVAEIVSATRTLVLTSAFALPDGSAPLTAGRGMGTTGLLRRADGGGTCPTVSRDAAIFTGAGCRPTFRRSRRNSVWRRWGCRSTFADRSKVCRSTRRTTRCERC